MAPAREVLMRTAADQAWRSAMKAARALQYPSIGEGRDADTVTLQCQALHDVRGAPWPRSHLRSTSSSSPTRQPPMWFAPSTSRGTISRSCATRSWTSTPTRANGTARIATTAHGCSSRSGHPRHTGFRTIARRISRSTPALHDRRAGDPEDLVERTFVAWFHWPMGH